MDPVPPTPEQPHHLWRTVFIVVVLLVVLGGVGVLVTKLGLGGPSWGSASYLMSFSDGTQVEFSKGVFATSTLEAPAGPRAMLHPALLADAVQSSSNPADYDVTLPNGTVIVSATEPVAIPGTDSVLVRTKDGISLCSSKGACSVLYAFNHAGGPVAYASSADTFVVADPYGILQTFTLDAQGALTPKATMKNPVPDAASVVFDSGTAGRLVFFSVSAGDPMMIPPPPGVPPSVKYSKSGSTRLTACAVDGALTGSPSVPACVHQDFLDVPLSSFTISAL